ncbi:hypothetical protein [Taklimakanibacter albus]|uniref:Uncharacterized protein n=1 Tax=Taklimakanibacter albus TaxID=2800327 RepID=A0ACC5RAA9_9HYPH|nr:hypothetical protein [Aestuariivirga sp. YIM B02566]MBK1869318.1 hypothetical protein [Aestuariivirga sp. YIM B02566]
MSETALNPPLSPWVRVFTGAALIVLIAGPLLLFAPQVIVPRWPWAIAPFNARFLGAVYCAELGALAVLFLDNRWSPGRASFVVAFVFTFVVTIASLIHLPAFVGARRIALWFVLYVGYAALSGGALLLYRQLPKVSALAVSDRFRSTLQVAGAVMTLYGVALFVAPGIAAGFWPWAIDAMHGQIYSAVFLAPGLGTLLLGRSAAREECLVGGVFNAGLGFFALVGFALAQAQTGRANLASPATWAWLLIFAVLLAIGIAMIRASRAKS